MKTKTNTFCAVCWPTFFITATAVLMLGFLSAFAQTARAQNATNQLTLANNFFVTGDYVVGGVGLRGLGDATGLATGTIQIPDVNSVPSTGVPQGAYVVAAFLYWETVEKNKSTFAGQNGFFNGFPIQGVQPGTNTPTSWSSGGCSGSANGTTVIRTYRADVRPFLPLDADGNVVGNGSYQVKLADSGSNGGGPPLTLGASLVIIYRILSPAVPLNSIVIYDGAVAPSNASSTMSQQMIGFYQAASPSPIAKLTHLVGDGQPNKTESVSLNTVNLPSLYPGVSPFPGVYNQNTISLTGGGSWDNPTWIPNNYAAAVNAGDSMATASVGPNGPGSGCVDWGAIIFSTTVQDTDGDGLLDAWEDGQGYVDAMSGQFVALPGANKLVSDLFVEVDYLVNYKADGVTVQHSHLTKQAALDMMGDAFAAAPQNIHVHFDVGPTNYAGCSTTHPAVCPDPYIIPGGTGGNAISENAIICTGATCQFPGSAAVGWKQGFLFLKNNATITLPNNTNVPAGNFQVGRKDSYHYVLAGHALGDPRSSWTTFGATLQDPSFAKLTSIVVPGALGAGSAAITLQSPQGLLKPGDCPNPAISACTDTNLDRITVAGALGQTALNGTYGIVSFNSTSPDANGVVTTTVTINTVGVANGTYNYANEPRLAVVYAGPTSSSGHSDLGGGDSEETFGLWRADDPANCQPDPAQPLTALNPTYCNDQLGTVLQQAGTLMHEVGHTLTLTHGGTYYSGNSSVPTYGLNCKPNFLSIMSYLFQVRGFPDGGIDYSGQNLQPLDETQLNEISGIGSDIITLAPAAHLTRWYAPPNALDLKIGRSATIHCDGTPKLPNETAVRVDGSFPTPTIDWNNNLIIPDLTEPVAWQDVNFNGSTSASPDTPFQGFNDWANVSLLQIGGRENALGFSGGSGAGARNQSIGGGTYAQSIGGGTRIQSIGGGANAQSIGGGTRIQSIGGGALSQAVGGGTEHDQDSACSTADAPSGLFAVQSGHNVILNWTAPGPQCQTRRYDVWRATGSFPTVTSALANSAVFTNLTPNGITGKPPVTTFTDSTVKNNTTYTYFVTDTNRQGAKSGASVPTTIFVKF